MRWRGAAAAALGTSLYLGCGLELGVGASDPQADAAARHDATSEPPAPQMDASSTDVAELVDAVTDAASPGDAAEDALVDAADEPDVRLPPVVGALTRGADADRTEKEDGTITTDAEDDASFTFELDGAVVALALLRTDENGVAQGNIWDTFVGSDPIPPDLSPGFTVGSQSWQLAVIEDGALKNDAAGRCPLAPGHHALRIYAADAGTFVTGNSFRLWVAAPDGSMVAGPILTL